MSFSEILMLDRWDRGYWMIYRRRWTAEWWRVGQRAADRWFMGEWIKGWHNFHSRIYRSNYYTLCSIPPYNTYSNLSFNSCQLAEPLKSAERIKHVAQRRHPTRKWSFPCRRTWFSNSSARKSLCLTTTTTSAYRRSFPWREAVFSQSFQLLSQREEAQVASKQGDELYQAAEPAREARSPS